MATNPYDPQLVTLTDTDEDYVYTGMRVLAEGYPGTVMGVRGMDGDVDDDGRVIYYPAVAHVVFDATDEYPQADDWVNLGDIEVTPSQYEEGKRRHSAYLASRQAQANKLINSEDFKLAPDDHELPF